jgi:hypothetical protein
LTAETLLLNGADASFDNEDDLTPLDLAQQLWHARVHTVMRSYLDKKARRDGR